MSEKSLKLYYCSNCDYETKNKKDYNKHLLTQKHLNSMNENKLFCECGKSYSCRQSLFVHSKKCYTFKEDEEKKIQEKIKESLNDKEFILTILKNNSEFMAELINNQNKFLAEQQNLVLETIKLSNNTNISNTSTQSNNTNSLNTNTFNLQIFLNETCKNAMNFSDFAKGIQSDLTDVEYVGKNGYVNGISNIVIKNISKLKVEERPMHCTDLRRETIYIKENDVWEKEDLSQEENKMIQLVRDVSLMNAKNVHIWRDKYPQCLTAYSDKTEQYNYIVHEALGGDTKFTTKQKEEKVISKIVKAIIIDKS
jgi:hypothetical protein